MTTGPTPDLNRITVEWGPFVYLDGSIPTGSLTVQYDGGDLIDQAASPARSIYIETQNAWSVPLSTVSIIVDGTPRLFAFASFDVPASNDPDIGGGGGTYTVTPVLSKGGGRPVSLYADIEAPNGVIRLNDITPTGPDAGDPVGVVTYQAFSDLSGRVADLEGGSALDSDLTAIAALTPSNDDLVQRKAGAWTNRTPAQVKTDLALAKGDVGLANVDNTADSAKPVSTAQQTALNLKAPLASPALTGTPTTPTAAAGTNTTQIASTAFVATEVAALIASAPGALDTLDELAAAMGDDANFAATVTTALAGKQPLDSDLTAIAARTTTAYGRAFLELVNQAGLMALLSAASTSASGIVELATSGETATGSDTARAVTPAGLKSVTDLLAPLLSPTFTGAPLVPTPSAVGAAAPKGYVDDQIAAAQAGFVTYCSTTPTVVTNSNTLATDANFPAIPVIANARYQLELFLLWTLEAGAGATTDVKMDFTAPAGTTGYWESTMVSWQQPGAAGAQTGLMKTFPGTAVACALAEGTQATTVRAIFETSSTAGNLVLRWAQNTAAAFDLTRLAGSNITLRRLA